MKYLILICALFKFPLAFATGFHYQVVKNQKVHTMKKDLMPASKKIEVDGIDCEFTETQKVEGIEIKEVICKLDKDTDVSTNTFCASQSTTSFQSNQTTLTIRKKDNVYGIQLGCKA